MTWIITNWEYMLLGFFVLEKIVKITPCKWDDLLVDGIKEGFMKFGKLARGKNGKG